MKIYTLENGRTKVPANSKVFKNQVKFSPVLLDLIDTSVIYEQYNMEYRIPARLSSDRTDQFYSVCRFYSNGAFNYYTINREELLVDTDFDPHHSGYRGIYYKENGKIAFDFWGITSQLGAIGKSAGEIEIHGDTLILYSKKPVHFVECYVKRKLPLDYFKYKATW